MAHCITLTAHFCIVDAFRHEHGRDIDGIYEVGSVCISDYVESLEHDARLIREAAGTPPHVNVYGYIYDIDDGSLTRVIEDRGVV